MEEIRGGGKSQGKRAAAESAGDDPVGLVEKLRTSGNVRLAARIEEFRLAESRARRSRRKKGKAARVARRKNR
jgi:hypothetical protein